MAYDNNKCGVTQNTPKNLMLGAGTIHKGLKYTDGTGWNFVESCIGATSGGNKLTITPELLDVDVDGATVKVAELTLKVGETATLEINMVEITPELVATAVIGKIGTSDAKDFDLVQSKAQIEAGDYFENISFVGTRQDGVPIIVILPNALCTNGLELDNKKKDKTVMKLTFECYQKIGENLNVLPWKIYYPTQTTNPTNVEGNN